MKNNNKRTFIESSFDIIFKMFSVIATTTTFALMSKSYLMLENIYYIFGVAFIGTLLGVFVAFIMYPKFYKNGNLLGMVIMGSIMTFFYFASAEEAYKTYLNHELKKDIQYSVLKSEKDSLTFDKKYKTEAEKLLKQESKKYKEVIKKASKKLEEYENKRSSHIWLFKDELKRIKWQNEEERIRRAGSEYSNIITAYEKKGYVIGALEDISQAKYLERLKELQQERREAINNMNNSTELKQLKEGVKKASSSVFIAKIRGLEERIGQRVEIVKARLILTEQGVKIGLIVLGLFVEIFLSSIFFLMDLFNGFMEKHNLLTTLHIHELEEEEIELDENILMIEHKSKSLIDELSDYREVYKSFKEIGGTNESRVKLNNFNQVLIGIVTATLANKKESFRETTQREAQQFMKQNFKNNIPSESIKIDENSFYPFGGNVARNFKTVQDALFGFEPKKIDMNQLLQISKSQM